MFTQGDEILAAWREKERRKERVTRRERGETNGQEEKAMGEEQQLTLPRNFKLLSVSH